MKTKSTLLLSAILVLFAITFDACKKEGCTDPTAKNYDEKADKDDDSCEYEEPTATAPCDAGIEFCMSYGGTNKSGDADFTEINSTRYRVYWTTGSGNAYEQVEFDIYGTATGTYSIDTTYSAGTAAFQFFSTADGVNNGVSGTLEITEFDFGSNGVTGTFTVTTEDGTEVTSGGINAAQ